MNKSQLQKIIKEEFVNKVIDMKFDKLTEAPMDKRFQKEWEQMHKAFINHLKHELKNK